MSEQIVLPERFIKCEYLQSTGTQWINTEYVPNNETGMYIDAEAIAKGDRKSVV